MCLLGTNVSFRRKSRFFKLNGTFWSQGISKKKSVYSFHCDLSFPLTYNMHCFDICKLARNR